METAPGPETRPTDGVLLIRAVAQHPEGSGGHVFRIYSGTLDTTAEEVVADPSKVSPIVQRWLTSLGAVELPG